MASFRLLMCFFATASMGWSSAEDISGAAISSIREPRHLHKKKLCLKYGICEGHGGYGGHGGFGGGHYQGHQGGYGGYGQPPINIAISQSQSSANEGGGGHAQGYYPHNNQFNGYGGHGGYGGYSGPSHGGFGGFGVAGGPGGFGGFGGPVHGGGYFGNGQGSYNNQFNGNYYRPQGGHGGYGFQKPGFGPFYDEGADEEGSKPEQSEHESDDVSQGSGTYNDYSQGGYNQGHHGPQNYAVAGAFAVAGRKN